MHRPMLTTFAALATALSLTPLAAAQCADCRCETEAVTAAPAADRAAILAMAGEFRVTFQFQETVAVAPGYELHEPYRSGATEFV